MKKYLAVASLFVLNNSFQPEPVLCDRFAAIDYAQAREDVRPFIRDASPLNLWSADFFCQITEELR